MRSGFIRVLAAALLIGAPVLSAAPVRAVTPPPVDDRLLPRAGPAAPRHPTTQSESCAAAPVARTVPKVDRPDLRAAWVRTRGAGQIVAVIDTGVARHRLLPHLVPGGDYVADGDGTADCDGHGTIVAGIIGAASDPGSFSGVAPEATILGIRQSSMKFRVADGSTGSGVGDVDSLAAAVRAAADQGATVINISSVACLGVADALDDRALGAALAYAVDIRNAVVVAAAGNVGGRGTCPEQNPLPDPAAPSRPDWDRVEVVASPSWYDDYVLTVGSVDAGGAPSTFSLAGPWVDVAAPGEAVTSLSATGEGLVDTMPDPGQPQPISGTSYAAPVVSGIAALIRAAAPELTARQVMQRIESTARRPASGWNPSVGHGVVDVLAAVRGIGEPAPPGSRRPSAPTTVAAADGRAGRFALTGAAVCAVLAVSAVLLPGRRSRRRTDDAVPDDRGPGGAEFGSAR
ncbi:type VII secretion-associated serine protease mycosin [Mycobacterium sp. AMU20-3851]|uniref:type VII secretion-associated serine protease mycosin n=1 Tax=Mycobacterium sp. AMU20-3851 TaxID=3122055 RepID=UPI003755063C